MNKQRGDAEVLIFVGIGFVVLVFIGVLFLVWPQYNVYSQRLSGEAALAHAHAARQVLVQQAQAEKDSAQLRADAIKIIGQAAKEFPEYRQQEFIGAFAEAMHSGKINQIIYVPTEGNIPLLEAGKRPH